MTRETIQFISNVKQTKRVVRTCRVRPDMPRHEPEIVTQGFHAANGAAVPFIQVLSEVDNNSHAGNETRQARPSLAHKAVAFFLTEGSEILHPKRGED